MNYFELFGFLPAPSVDRSVLAKKYFELQKNSHPDFFTQSSEIEKEEAMEKSAAINKAFNIFQNSEKTIAYFLQLKGLIEPEEKYNLPPEFLMEMMEINEALTEDDAATVKLRIADYERELYEEVKSIIDNYQENTSTADLQQLKAYYYKKKYLKRILDRLAD